MKWHVIFLLACLVSPFFNLAQPEGNGGLNGFYSRFEKDPPPLPHIREANVMWSKRIWRKLDLREKMNHPLYYPTEPTANRVSLAQLLIGAAEEGSITAYDPFDDSFTTQLTKAQVNAKLIKVDTFWVDQPDPPYTPIKKEIITRINYGDIKEFRIKEDWIFDKERSVLEVRIIGIQPVKENIDPTTGEVRGTEPLFWFYFPEARKFLVNTPVFNRFNDGAQLSLDDLFLKRMFASYIYKSNNVYDRRINEYTTGIDAMLESEGLKEDIFRYEEELWEY